MGRPARPRPIGFTRPTCGARKIARYTICCSGWYFERTIQGAIRRNRSARGMCLLHRCRRDARAIPKLMYHRVALGTWNPDPSDGRRVFETAFVITSAAITTIMITRSRTRKDCTMRREERQRFALAAGQAPETRNRLGKAAPTSYMPSSARKSTTVPRPNGESTEAPLW